jgi:hypothetical protein
MVFRSHQFFLHVHVKIQISTIGDRVPPLQPWSTTWPTEYGIFDSDSSGSHSRTAIESPFLHPIWSVRSGSQFRLEKRERTSSGWRRSRGVINPRRRPPSFTRERWTLTLALPSWNIQYYSVTHFQVSVYQAHRLGRGIGIWHRWAWGVQCHTSTLEAQMLIKT